MLFSCGHTPEWTHKQIAWLCNDVPPVTVSAARALLHKERKKKHKHLAANLALPGSMSMPLREIDLGVYPASLISVLFVHRARGER